MLQIAMHISDKLVELSTIVKALNFRICGEASLDGESKSDHTTIVSYQGTLILPNTIYDHSLKGGALINHVRVQLQLTKAQCEINFFQNI